ncbi:hypothetical protein, partial [Erythrobacter sp. YJ-T3-07]|uniref:hypothetical protein n=1 Tax=Erythrobacter sp. YJ-T3-07 TaxID=2793063 RepID=UPI001F4426CA
RDRQAVESARRRLWGTSISGSRSVSFDVYDNLYKLANHLLMVSYHQVDEFKNSGIVELLLNEIAGFLSRCNQLLVFKALVNLQGSIGVWIEDANAQYSSRHFAGISEAVGINGDLVLLQELTYV